MEIQPGDMLEVVEGLVSDSLHPGINIGQKYICNSVLKCKCKRIGIDIGLTALKMVDVYCVDCRNKMNQLLPTVYYSPRLFRIIPPPYKLVEVNSEILKQAKKLILT